jgi:plastocyanin
MSDPGPIRQQRSRQGMDYGETANVLGIHAAIRREKREPRVGREPLSLWLIGIYAIAIFSGGFYFGRYAGYFSGDSLDPGGTQQLVRKSSVPGQASQQMVELSPAAPAVVVGVSMRNLQFEPRTVEIKKGDVVEWKNDDFVAHTVTSASFDSGAMQSGQTWRHTFTEAGNFSYACTFHPPMTAVVIVK